MNIFRRYKTFDEIRKPFLEEKDIELSKKTVISYRGKTGLFSVWLKSQGLSDIPLRKITSQNIADFFIFLARGRKLDKPTCEKYFVNIRSLFQYAQKRDEVEVIPFDLVVLPQKKEDRGAGIILPEHLHILLEDIKKNDLQLFLFCMIEYYCFVRPGTELRLMRVGDIDMDQGIIKIPAMNAKNGHFDTVTMPNHLIGICREYGIDKADKSLYVFSRHKQIGVRPFAYDVMRYRFNKYREKHVLPKEYKLYSFKHSGATALHQSGISMRELMDQLRHTKLEATQHYVKKHIGIVNERIRDKFPNPIVVN